MLMLVAGIFIGIAVGITVALAVMSDKDAVGDGLFIFEKDDNG